MLHSGVSAGEEFVFAQALKEIFPDITCFTPHRPATNWSVWPHSTGELVGEIMAPGSEKVQLKIA